ncbi:MAG: WYL domain-containing transcriptional regulator [Planctomycetota bacterium]
MARNEQLIRQHKILQILERVRYGKTLSELQSDIADELGLKAFHTRTLRRDLEALQAVGYDIDVHDSQRGKVWKLGPRSKTATKISFSATELIALSLGRQLMHPLAGTPFWMGIESFWSKVNEQVPDSVLAHYQKFDKTLRVLGLPAKSYEKQHGVIKTINRGVMEHRVVEVVYQKPGESPKTRQIEPYTVVLFQSSIYIIAAACEDEDPSNRIRKWKLDRFSKATLLDQWFQIPEDLDLDAFVGNSMSMFFDGKQRAQKYKIRVDSKAASWVIEDPLHADQTIKELNDGSIEVTVPASQPMEIIPRVLSMGVSAEIVSPKTARKQIAEMVQQMAAKY